MRYSILCCFTALLLLASCDSGRVFEENLPIDGGTWKSGQILTFKVDIQDTLSGNNFYINLRHGDQYPYSNIYLFMKTRFPNGKFAQDTLELVLQNPNGQWNGKGLGDRYDHQIMFKRNLRFPLKGAYEFSLIQAMNDSVLSDIEEAGLRIERFAGE